MKKNILPMAAAVTLLLPAVYLTSYLALVVPGGIFVPQRVNVIRFLGHYRVAPDHCRWVFLPLELMDRQLRPRAWENILTSHLEQ